MSAPPAAPRRVVSLGDLVMDIITPVKLPILPFQHQEASEFRPEPGGGCNFIIAALRLGLRVTALGAVGDDAYGAELIAILRAEGADMSAVWVAPGSNTATVLDLIDLDTHQHVFIGHKANGAPTPYSVGADQAIRAADALFFQGYTLLETQLVEFVDEVLQRARDYGKLIFFDSGPTVAYTTRERLAFALAHSDIVLMTEDEISVTAPGLSGEAAFEALFAQGVKVLVIKQGAAGCTVITPDERISVPGFPVRVVDTVGAGDCFDAAFIYGMVHRLGLRDCALLANAAGAAMVQKLGGGRSAPTRTEVEALLRAHTSLELP